MKTIFEKIKNTCHLPQLPQVMLKLIKACNDETSDTDDLARIISTDPALASTLIRIISSPYINLPEKVTTIKTAVVYLGLDTIRNIAVSSSAIHFFKMAKILPRFDINRFWYHSYKCAVLARRIAIEKNQTHPDEYFLAGLLHDMGSLILMQAFPEKYAAVLDDEASGIPSGYAQTTHLGVDTPRVSAWLFTQWQLPAMASHGVILLNESPHRIQKEPYHVKILYTASVLACPQAMDKIQDVQKLTGIPEDRLGRILEETDTEVLKMAESMGINFDTDRDREKENKDQEQRIGNEIQNASLVYGTMDTLLEARNVQSVLNAVQKGLEIIFHVPRVFFFLPDREKNIITGITDKRDRCHNIVKSIALPLDTRASLLVRSIHTGQVQTSAGRDNLSASDSRILRLLETDGLYCIPIMARGRGTGVIVLGADNDLTTRLNAGKGVIRLFSRQAGVCLENINFHQTYARDINQKKMEAYKILTDKVIHEINNPIAIINNYLESLKLNLPDTHTAQEELAVVEEEMYRVCALVEGLSAFSQPKIGRREKINLNRFIDRILGVLKKSLLLSRQIHAETNFDKNIPGILLDGDGLKQILINLVKNAAEAMEDGGEILISTRLQAGSTKVLIDEKRKIPGFVEIRIEDTGPGIAPRIKKRLFEPYNSTKKRGRNSGLGLAVVHTIVKEMKGRITCSDREGKGTCFRIFFPLSPERP